jgi:hypothetical protein
MSAYGHAADDLQLLCSKVLSLAHLALYRLKEKAADNHVITPVSWGGDTCLLQDDLDSRVNVLTQPRFSHALLILSSPFFLTL